MPAVRNRFIAILSQHHRVWNVESFEIVRMFEFYVLIETSLRTELIIQVPVWFWTVLMGAFVMPGDISSWPSDSFFSVSVGVTVTIVIFLSFFLHSTKSYFKFVEFSQQLTFLNGKLLEMGLEHSISEIEFTKLLVIINLFLLFFFFTDLIDGTSFIFLFGVILFYFMQNNPLCESLLFSLDRIHIGLF